MKSTSHVTKLKEKKCEMSEYNMESREQPREANLQGKPESSFCSALRCVHKIDLKNAKTQRKKSNIC